MLSHPPILRLAEPAARTLRLHEYAGRQGLAWTVLIVEAAGVLMLLLTAALRWPRRSAPRSAGG
jgi:hypothetical protein